MDTLSRPGKVILLNILQSALLLYLEPPVAPPGMLIISDILPGPFSGGKAKKYPSSEQVQAC
jgi:hypothetical protein